MRNITFNSEVHTSLSFYLFLKRLNKLNSSLPDSLKIRQHYTNSVSLDNIYTHAQYEDLYSKNYDSSMAAHVIEGFDKI